MVPFTIINQKATGSKFALENYFFHFFVINRHTVKLMITLCISKLIIMKNKFFLSKHVVKLTKYELTLIAGNRGIKNYLNMSREKLLSTIDKS